MPTYTFRMPRNPIDYNNTCFYKLVCKDLSIKDCYVGHTTDFNSRRRGHKTTCNNTNAKNYNLFVYQFIREHGGWDNFDMIAVERTSCSDSLDAKRKEREYIEKLSATLNKAIPSRTKVEWTNDNIERVRENKHRWHVENIERLKTEKREMYKANREYILNKSKQHYADNAEKVKAWKNCKTQCECGDWYSNANRARHMRSMKHQQYKAAKIEVEDD